MKKDFSLFCNSKETLLFFFSYFSSLHRSGLYPFSLSGSWKRRRVFHRYRSTSQISSDMEWLLSLLFLSFPDLKRMTLVLPRLLEESKSHFIWERASETIGNSLDDTLFLTLFWDFVGFILLELIFVVAWLSFRVWKDSDKTLFQTRLMSFDALLSRLIQYLLHQIKR